MYNIKPKKVIFDQDEAVKIDINIINDNLKDSCLLNVSFIKENDEILLSRHVACTGEDYENWDNSNEQIVHHCANDLELELI